MTLCSKNIIGSMYSKEIYEHMSNKIGISKSFSELDQHLNLIIIDLVNFVVRLNILSHVRCYVKLITWGKIQTSFCSYLITDIYLRNDTLRRVVTFIAFTHWWQISLFWVFLPDYIFDLKTIYRYISQKEHFKTLQSS